jgi:hypothetical protein
MRKKKRMKTFHPLSHIKLQCFEDEEEEHSNNFLQKHNYVHLKLTYFLFI